MRKISGHDVVFVIDSTVVDQPLLLSAVMKILYPYLALDRHPWESNPDYLTRAHGAKGLMFTQDQAQIRVTRAAARQSRSSLGGPAGELNC